MVKRLQARLQMTSFSRCCGDHRKAWEKAENLDEEGQLQVSAAALTWH